MKRFAVLVGLLLLTLGLATRGVEAATVIKLATLVPDGSVWDKALKEMGADWKESSDGRVTLRIYPGGVAGDEPDVVRKMRIGQIQAASLTVTGLSEIDPAFKVFTIPLFYDSYEELLFVLEAMEPYLAAKLEARGFVFVHWGHAGWVHLFSKDPIRQIDDLKQQKLFVWAGQDDMVQWWMRSGFKPVALAATDIMTGLQTGMIEVLPTTPLAALNLQ
ncbi:MAG: TRAP transporter substrate-binding protein DctP, partial [Thermoanaerobaculia bacterium]